MLIKTEKMVHIKKNARSFINVVREHYLRDDIPCKSECCKTCEQPNGTYHTYSTKCCKKTIVLSKFEKII